VVTNAARIDMREWTRSPVECNVISYDSLLEDTPLDSTAHSHSRHLIQNCAQNAYSMLFIEDTTTNPSFSNSSLRWTCRHDRVCPVPNQSGDSDMHQAILHHNLLDTIPNPTSVLQQYEQSLWATFHLQFSMLRSYYHLRAILRHANHQTVFRYIKPGSSILSFMCCPMMGVHGFGHDLINLKWF